MTKPGNVERPLSDHGVSNSYRRQLVVGISLALLFLITTFVFGTYAATQYSRVQSAWTEYADRVSRFDETLATLHRALGFGGFIHNFKNLVLRKNLEHYSPRVERDYQALQKTFREMDTLMQSQEDRAAVDTIRSTVNEYYQKFNIAKRMIRNGATSQQIDAVVRVDDNPALQAIGVLESHAKKDLVITRQHANQLFDKAVFNLTVSAIAYVIALMFGFVVIVRSQRRLMLANTQLALAQNRLNNLLENSPDAMLTVNARGAIVRANKMAERFLGYPKSELLNMNVEQLMPESFRNVHTQHRERFFHRPSPRSMGSSLPLVALTKSGQTPNVDISLSYVEEQGEILVNATLRDTTARERDKRALVDAAFQDPLTGIGNRRKFLDVAHHEIDRAKRTHASLWFLVIDIDDFKAINDTAGHATGDEVIKAVARVIQESIRTDDLACRTGGEEFTVLLVDTSADGATRVAETIRAGVESLAIAGWTDRHGAVTVSTGCAFYDDTRDLKDVLRRADNAMYEAKKYGKNQFRLADPVVTNSDQKIN